MSTSWGNAARMSVIASRLRMTGSPRTGIDVSELVNERTPTRTQLSSVRVIDGVVTLRGVVPSHAMRELAAHVARSVRGARDVVSQLELSSDPRHDAEIRGDVQRARSAPPAPRWSMSSPGRVQLRERLGHDCRR